MELRLRLPPPCPPEQLESLLLNQKIFLVRKLFVSFFIGSRKNCLCRWCQVPPVTHTFPPPHSLDPIHSSSASQVTTANSPISHCPTMSSSSSNPAATPPDPHCPSTQHPLLTTIELSLPHFPNSTTVDCCCKCDMEVVVANSSEESEQHTSSILGPHLAKIKSSLPLLTPLLAPLTSLAPPIPRPSSKTPPPPKIIDHSAEIWKSSQVLVPFVSQVPRALSIVSSSSSSSSAAWFTDPPREFLFLPPPPEDDDDDALLLFDKVMQVVNIDLIQLERTRGSCNNLKNNLVHRGSEVKVDLSFFVKLQLINPAGLLSPLLTTPHYTLEDPTPTYHSHLLSLKTSCLTCSRKILLLPHHCKMCGGVSCGSCLKPYLVPHLGYNAPLKICPPCRVASLNKSALVWAVAAAAKIRSASTKSAVAYLGVCCCYTRAARSLQSDHRLPADLSSVLTSLQSLATSSGNVALFIAATRAARKPESSASWGYFADGFLRSDSKVTGSDVVRVLKQVPLSCEETDSNWWNKLGDQFARIRAASSSAGQRAHPAASTVAALYCFTRSNDPSEGQWWLRKAKQLAASATSSSATSSSSSLLQLECLRRGLKMIISVAALKQQVIKLLQHESESTTTTTTIPLGLAAAAAAVASGPLSVDDVTLDIVTTLVRTKAFLPAATLILFVSDNFHPTFSFASDAVHVVKAVRLAASQPSLDKLLEELQEESAAASVQQRSKVAAVIALILSSAAFEGWPQVILRAVRAGWPNAAMTLLGIWRSSTSDKKSSSSEGKKRGGQRWTWLGHRLLLSQHEPPPSLLESSLSSAEECFILGGAAEDDESLVEFLLRLDNSSGASTIAVAMNVVFAYLQKLSLMNRRLLRNRLLFFGDKLFVTNNNKSSPLGTVLWGCYARDLLDTFFAPRGHLESPDALNLLRIVNNSPVVLKKLEASMAIVAAAAEGDEDFLLHPEVVQFLHRPAFNNAKDEEDVEVMLSLLHVLPEDNRLEYREASERRILRLLQGSGHLEETISAMLLHPKVTTPVAAKFLRDSSNKSSKKKEDEGQFLRVISAATEFLSSGGTSLFTSLLQESPSLEILKVAAKVFAAVAAADKNEAAFYEELSLLKRNLVDSNGVVDVDQFPALLLIVPPTEEVAETSLVGPAKVIESLVTAGWLKLKQMKDKEDVADAAGLRKSLTTDLLPRIVEQVRSADVGNSVFLDPLVLSFALRSSLAIFTRAVILSSGQPLTPEEERLLQFFLSAASALSPFPHLPVTLLPPSSSSKVLATFLLRELLLLKKKNKKRFALLLSFWRLHGFLRGWWQRDGKDDDNAQDKFFSDVDEVVNRGSNEEGDRLMSLLGGFGLDKTVEAAIAAATSAAATVNDDDDVDDDDIFLSSDANNTKDVTINEVPVNTYPFDDADLALEILRRLQTNAEEQSEEQPAATVGGIKLEWLD